MSLQVYAISLDESNVSNPQTDDKKPRKRKETDRCSLLILFVVICGLGALVAYCAYNGDIYRIINGFDDCKNICGRQNFILDGNKFSDCEGLDMRLRPFLLVFIPNGQDYYNATFTGKRALDINIHKTLSKNISRICLHNCSAYIKYQKYKNRCVVTKSQGSMDRFPVKTGIANFFDEIAQDLALTWRTILWLEIGVLATSYALTILITLFPGIAIVLVLNVTVVACFVFAVYLWILWINSKASSEEVQGTKLANEVSYVILMFTATFLCVPTVFFKFTMRKRVTLICQLFKETTRVIRSMPLLLAQPLLTSSFVSAIISAWFYFSLITESAGNQQRIRNEFFTYKKDVFVIISRWYNIFACLWLVQFVMGCQHIIVAGAVSRWYFCRTKNDLGLPIFNGFYNLVKYHLGSVALGSFLILLIPLPKRFFQVVGVIIKSCKSRWYSWLRTWAGSCMGYTKTAYIEIAIMGITFYGARQEVISITAKTKAIISTVDTMVNFVFTFINILFILVTTFFGIYIFKQEESILHLWFLLVVMSIFTYLICGCFLSLVQMTIDTLFVCFSEDLEKHNGVSEPYYIHQELSDIIKDLKMSK